MSTWTLSFKDTFLNELLDLPQDVSKQVTKSVRLLEHDPLSVQLNARKLVEFKNNIYRIRIGKYRLVYSFGQGWIKLLSIRKRDEKTYSRNIPTFDPPPPLPDQSMFEMDEPDGEVASWGIAGATASAPPSVSPVDNPLPREITHDLLEQWLIPYDYWNELLAVQTEEELLNLSVPQHLLARIIDNLFPAPLAQVDTRPEYVLNTPDDLDRFVEGDLTAFLLKLDPDQQKLRDFGGAGPMLVKGGPGTGKSTLALYRVQKLRDQGIRPILFTTYTNALVKYSEQLLEHLLGEPLARCGIEVSTLDVLARRYFVRKYGSPTFVNDRECLTYLERALESAEIPGKSRFDQQVRRQTLDRLGTTYVLQEIRSVIEGWGLMSCDEYLSAPRTGRMIPLKANIREAIWAVYEAYRDAMVQDNVVSWEQMRWDARLEAEALTDKPYQAIVIDEAQDLSPVALRFLLELVPSLRHVYLTADASQSLYQRGFSWKHIHADLKVTGRTVLLKRNYRNTAQIAAACASILSGTAAGDAECLVQELSPYVGEPPSLVFVDRQDQEARTIHSFLTTAARQFRLPLHGSAVLCPKHSIAYRITDQLRQMGLQAEFMSGKEIDLNKPVIKVLTLHSAKGLEFPFVVVVGLDEGLLPHVEDTVPPDEIPAVLDEQRRLFYVGCSRAMRALMVCGSRSHPSSFVTTLAAPHWLQKEVAV